MVRYPAMHGGPLLVGALLLIWLPTPAESGRFEGWIKRKIELCHVSPKDPSVQREIVVGPWLAKAHLLRHPGDRLGPCLEPADCPCWTTEELRSAVASDCELSVDPLSERFSAALRFQDLAGVRSDGVRVEFNAERMCIVFVDGLELGLVPILVEDLGEAEAATCARRVDEVCRDLLP